MNQLLMERYLTHSRVKKNEKSEEKVEEMLFVYGYWVDLVEYGGEKKERYKFLDGNNEVRKFYEGLFGDYVLLKEYVRFLDMGVQKKEKNKEGTASSFTKENVSKFIALRKLENFLVKEFESTDRNEVISKEEGVVKKDELIKIAKRVKRHSQAPVENPGVKKRFPGRRLVLVLKPHDTKQKQGKRITKGRVVS